MLFAKVFVPTCSRLLEDRIIKKVPGQIPTKYGRVSIVTKSEHLRKPKRVCLKKWLAQIVHGLSKTARSFLEDRIINKVIHRNGLLQAFVEGGARIRWNNKA